VFLKTILRKIFNVVGYYGIRLASYGSRQDMPVIWVGAVETFYQFGWNSYDGLGKCPSHGI
jgi:hypothetical protein